MPGTSTSKNPSGISITFEEKSHKYWSKIGDKTIYYTSGTAFVHRFVPEFDEKRVSELVARKRGITQQEVLDEWKAKRDESCYFGTKVHETAEDVLNGRPFRNTPQNPKEEIVFGRAKAFANKFKNELDILGVEQIVFDHRLKIAGTIDLLARSKKDGSILVLDWKTNAEVKRENNFEKCLAPIDHLDNCNFWHYSLQLNLYQFLLTFGGYYPKDAKFKRALIHINTETAEVIQLPDMQNEIKDMMIYSLLSNS